MSQTSFFGEFSNDDEVIFFGKISRKEVLVRLLGNKQLQMDTNHRTTISCADSHVDEETNLDQSIKIIETHSTPNINLHFHNEIKRPLSEMKVDSTPNIMCKKAVVDLAPDDSFLVLEKMIENCTTRAEANCEVFENPEIIEPTSSKRDQNEGKKQQNKLPPKAVITSSVKVQPPAKSTTTPKYDYSTPQKLIKQTPVFKTPCQPALNSHNKQNTTQKKQFQHVASPVAYYIKNSPVVPLIQNVRPSKPLPGLSSIPKPKAKKTVVNKENVCLPSVAYQSAKETKVIKFPGDHKLPESQWAKQVASSIPRRVVMKHVHRENCCDGKPVHVHDNSYQNLSLHRADVSICTEKCQCE